MNAFEAAVLARHNEYRARHGVPLLTWNSTLADYGYSYINEIESTDHSACSGTLVHSPRTGLNFGENLAYGTITDTQAVDLWYDENVYYNYQDPSQSSGDFEQYGHFTQLIWRASTQLGCAIKRCNGNIIYVICEYHPQGNIFLAGDDQYYFFKRNVPAPIAN